MMGGLDLRKVKRLSRIRRFHVPRGVGKCFQNREGRRLSFHQMRPFKRPDKKRMRLAGGLGGSRKKQKKRRGDARRELGD